MNTLIAVSGLVVLGIVFINRSVPNVGEALSKTAGNLEYEKTKQLGVANVGEVVSKQVRYIDPYTGEKKSEKKETVKGPYMQCTTDLNCQGDALLGARYRCIGGTCTPFVKMENILFNPVELGLHKVCNRYYLGGQGSPCNHTKQCSLSGITCDPDDPNCEAAPWNDSSDVYCGNKNVCEIKTNPDWLGIRWKLQDLTYDRAKELGWPNKIQENIDKIKELSYVNDCPQLIKEMTPK